ncbi:LPS assembly lipoprotein LptE [Roseibacterium sp. SDUM158017]|uniref:LPS assembly lipoprotein LptE n=1 Tax=Roseicyclus salinarum TaxID=3036773 RepID=UPI0024158EA2|nr:LPS assembly lipoprotein LptE [Roseibacterium sp. SDUM158017]MDG4646813.1 LPS assembly lipoprotein LptE [Roseibacterium sp. SDUM158017]
MSSSDRRSFLALLGALPLAACGFTPVYGPGGTGGAVRGRVDFADPDSALEFSLVARLEDRIGRAAGAQYLLDYTIRTRESALALTGAEDINRININGTATFTVTDTATGAQVQSGEVTTFTAFASSGSPVATTAARRDAEQRLMIALADQIVSRLLAGADDWP